MSKFAFLAAATLVTGSMVVTDVADAQSRRYHHRDRDREYRGDSGRYRRDCSGGNGAVGTIAGGAGGAVLGNVVGGGTLGTVAGGVGGALLGRHLDKKNTRHRNGC